MSNLVEIPFQRTLEQFDFGFQPSIDQRQVKELASLAFVADAANLLLLGPPGVGKTHLAVALAIKAIEHGYGAYFVRAYDLMEDLRKARAEHRLDRRMRVYLAPKVLIVDEFGIWPYGRESATAFFTLVSARYERGSIILTSNKVFADWGELLGDTVIATAILDRLLHHSHVLNIRGESYRLKDKRQAGLLTSPHMVSPGTGPMGDGERQGVGQISTGVDTFPATSCKSSTAIAEVEVRQAPRGAGAGTMGGEYGEGLWISRLSRYEYRPAKPESPAPNSSPTCRGRRGRGETYREGPDVSGRSR